jgi:anti-anti-sigma factor
MGTGCPPVAAVSTGIGGPRQAAGGADGGRVPASGAVSAYGRRMTDGVQFSVRFTEAPPTFTVSGDIDIASCGQLAEAVRADLPAVNGSAVVFDLTDVSFIDSSGLAVLIDTVNRGHQVTVRGASPVLQRVIEATGLTEVLEVER